MRTTPLVLDEFLPFRLSITSNLVSGAVASVYEALFGLTIPEWRVVAVVGETGGITQAAIGARTRMDKVTVSRAAIALVDRGIVQRRPNPDDGRSHRLTLSDAGRDLYAAVVPKALEMERRILERLGERDAAKLRELLSRIDAAVVSLIDAG